MSEGPSLIHVATAATTDRVGGMPRAVAPLGVPLRWHRVDHHRPHPRRGAAMIQPEGTVLPAALRSPLPPRAPLPGVDLGPDYAAG